MTVAIEVSQTPLSCNYALYDIANDSQKQIHMMVTKAHMAHTRVTCTFPVALQTQSAQCKSGPI